MFPLYIRSELGRERMTCLVRGPVGRLTFGHQSVALGASLLGARTGRAGFPLRVSGTGVVDEPLVIAMRAALILIQVFLNYGLLYTLIADLAMRTV
jgi:hypothetical protein